MPPFGARYPAVLQAAIDHAQRLRALLEDQEARLYPGDRRERWLIGRAGEVQCVVAILALDWHHDRLGAEEAATRLSRYLKEVHDGMAMHLDIGRPSCCRAPLARARPREDERSERPKRADRRDERGSSSVLPRR